VDPFAVDDLGRIGMDDHINDPEHNRPSAFSSFASGAWDGDLSDGFRCQHGGWICVLGTPCEFPFFSSGAGPGGGGYIGYIASGLGISDR
jgi:hypothetical protein